MSRLSASRALESTWLADASTGSVTAEWSDCQSIPADGPTNSPDPRDHCNDRSGPEGMLNGSSDSNIATAAATPAIDGNVNETGQTGLHRAAFGGDRDLVKDLLAAGARSDLWQHSTIDLLLRSGNSGVGDYGGTARGSSAEIIGPTADHSTN